MRIYTHVVQQRVVEELVEWDENVLHAATRAFGMLAQNPNQPPDLSLAGFGGRRISLKRFGHLVVSYWEDSPVHEIRIVALALR